MTISQLQIGDIAEIKKILKFNTFTKRILDIGLTKNNKIKIVNFAPLGDPIAIEINSSIISIRKEDARYIEVKLLYRRLANLDIGQKGKISHFYGGRTFLEKMRKLNIKISDLCEMIDNKNMPLKVKINNNIYFLPYGMALKINVEVKDE